MRGIALAARLAGQFLRMRDEKSAVLETFDARRDRRMFDLALEVRDHLICDDAAVGTSRATLDELKDALGVNL